MNGIELCRLIRESAKLKMTPILLVSAVQKDSESAVQGLKAGADDYLVAPYDPMRLVTKVAQLIERKRMEKALRQSEERYRGLFENAHDIIYTQDLAGNFTSVNKVAESVTGYTRDEILRMNFAEHFSEEDAQKMRSMTDKKLSGEVDSTSYEISVRGKHGRIVPLEVSTTLIYENGRPVGVQGIARDITERKKAAEALSTSQEQLQQSQKLEAIGQLAGGVAHDFNNLLTAIIGYSDLSLPLLGTNDPIRRNLVEIKKAADRAASLTRQLLAFSRKQILDPKVLDLNLVVKDMSKMLRRLIGEDIELVTVLQNDLGRVKADPGQVEQIVMNLIVNARDAMPNGGKITIETANVRLDEGYRVNHAQVETGDYVMLAVTDTGHGIYEETQSHIFEPFFTTKPAGKGTGLGLSTVYGIVKQSGGYIWVYSEVGHGASFKIYLRRIDDQPLSEKPTPLQNEHGGHETVLLVEDEPVVREMVCEILQSKGYRVLSAGSGEEALRLWQTHRSDVDLLLTDLIMPGMSGRVLGELLLHVRPDLAVVYMSGYTDDAIVRHGLLAEGLEFIQKPFTPTGLALKVRGALDTSPRKHREQ
jgi:PAS domain S-box-containing protein